MMGTPLRRRAPASEMAEAELHKERLQALAEKRKRQAEIEDKRRQLDDLVLQLQHLKSKAMRERWLLQGTAGPHEEDEGRRRQVEQDEVQVKKLEDVIHRLESEIGLLENEELQISAKEKVLRERLRETERSIEDLQKSLQNQDGDAVNYVCSQIPNLPELSYQTPATASGDHQPPRKPAVYAMEISVEKDRNSGGTKILSASPVSPEEAHRRGVKVYDDGRKVIYEVRSGASTTLENGVHPWSSDDVDELMQQVGQARTRPESGRVIITPPEPEPKPSPGFREQTVQKEPKQGMMAPSNVQRSYEGEVMQAPEATSENPVTMIFMGYHSVDDEEETKKLLGFDGTIKAEIVLIDEDDEKSLREKTVTDVSAIDGNAADLVSGRPLSEATELSSEGKDESSAKEPPPPPAGCEKARCVLLTAENGLFPSAGVRPSHGPEKSTRLSEDDSELKSERCLKSVSFLDPVGVISGDKINMELEAQSERQPNLATNGQNGVKHRGEPMDSEVAQEILYLDEVLEANCSDPGAEMTSNGTCSPEYEAISVDGSGPSVHVSDVASSVCDEVVVEGKKQTTYVDDNLSSGKPNGHSEVMDSSPSRSPETEITIKKEARFELRAFNEEKKPSKLFDTPTEKEVRVKKVRPSEEVAELERERLELIRDQAVKKNPGIAAKWWNPPQEKPLEEELEPEQLESLKRYQERKQKRPEMNRISQTSPKQTVYFAQPSVGNKEDIVVQGIDFSAARQQFVQMEHSKEQPQQQASKRSVAPQMYSAKPFSRVIDTDRTTSSITVTSHGRVIVEDGGEMSQGKSEMFVGGSADSSPHTKDNIRNDDFTCARAVMTILKDEDSDLYHRSMNTSYHPEEIDSGLDDLSLRSQDTTVLETLSNDFSMDNISDSGASNETMSAFLENSLGDCSFPSTPMATTPINGKLEGSTKSPQVDSLTEEELEYHAGILVQNAIQHAIAQQNDKWEPPQAFQQSSPIPERHVEVSEPSPPSTEEKSPYLPPPQELSLVEEKKTIAPEINVQMPAVQTAPVVPVNTYRAQSPSPPPNEKPEFSYFSKYSEAAELRSTASVTRAQDVEVTSGPFKLRSRKQRTLSMIEEEIRAAQEREEELRRERQTQSLRPTINPTRKQKTNSLPSKLVLTGKTAPGKIEKIRVAPPVSPCSSDGALPSPLSDLGSDDSGGSHRPKNFMQTLMEDYETHKVKRREKAEDNSVLEATRVTRRKSNMALRWEAGIYANQGEAEEEEEEE